jgi:alanine dehydrogenase
MVSMMRPGSVIVDVAVDQGGCIETTHETTHEDPTYFVHDVLHYAVGNMPAAVPHTSTYALTNATLPYVVALAEQGIAGAVASEPALRGGVNSVSGVCANAAVAEALGVEAADPLELLLSR